MGDQARQADRDFEAVYGRGSRCTVVVSLGLRARARAGVRGKGRCKGWGKESGWGEG